MAEEQTWVEALEISEEDLRRWSEQVPSGMPLLAWCLEHGHVPLDRYLDWASESYGLPVLESRFFAEAFDASTLSQMRSDWSPWSFPVEVWDGITIVACVEPPHERQEGYSYVLADPTALHEAWGQSDARISLPPPPPTEIKKSRASLSVEDAEPPLIAPEGDPLDIPLGVNLNAPRKFKLQLAGFESDDVAQPSDPPQITQPVLTPEMPPVLQVPDLSLDEVVVDADPTEPPAAPEIASSENVTEEFTQSQIVDAVTATQHAQPTVTVAQTARPLPTAHEVAEAMEQAFVSIRKDYKGAVLLRCTDSDALVSQSDPNLKLSIEPSKIQIALNSPSLLRIVFKTKLPYHGFVLDTPLHREFFQKLGQQELPGCVTAVPITDNGELTGILLAFGDEKVQTPKALESIEKIAEQLTSQIGGEWLKSA